MLRSAACARAGRDQRDRSENDDDAPKHGMHPPRKTISRRSKARSAGSAVPLAGPARQARGGGLTGTGVRVAGSTSANSMVPAAVRSVARAWVGSSVPGSGTPGTIRAPSRPHDGAQSRTSEAGVVLAPAIGHVASVPQPVACMGHEAMPQQDFAGARAGGVACPLPSTAAHTGDSVKRPGASAARIRRARTKARIERITPTSYTMMRDRIHFGPAHSGGA